MTENPPTEQTLRAHLLTGRAVESPDLHAGPHPLGSNLRPIRGPPKSHVSLSRALCPAAVLLLGFGTIVFGLLCPRTPLQPHIPACRPIFVSIGLLLPGFVLLTVIYLNIPSKRKLALDNFYSDALLEEILTSESVEEVYYVSGRENKSEGIVVFLVGVGSVPEVFSYQVDAVTIAGYCAIVVQLPGSGALKGVRFSLSRAERVVLRALEREGVWRQNRSVDASEIVDCSDEAMDYFMDDDLPSPRGYKFILASWGLSSHVIMHLVSSQRLGNKCLVGVVLYCSTYMPQRLGFLKKLEFASYRIYWISTLVKWRQYAFLHPELRELVSLDLLNPEARADWAADFNDWYSVLRSACGNYEGAVLCISRSRTNLENMERIWSKAAAQNSLTRVHLEQLRRGGSSYFFTRQNDLHDGHLLRFLHEQFVHEDFPGNSDV